MKNEFSGMDLILRGLLAFGAGNPNAATFLVSEGVQKITIEKTSVPPVRRTTTKR